MEYLEEVLRARQRAKTRQGSVMFVSDKFRQKIATSPDRGHARTQPRRSVQVVKGVSDSESEPECVSSKSDGDGDLRRMYTVLEVPDAGKIKSGGGPNGPQGPAHDRNQ